MVKVTLWLKDEVMSFYKTFETRINLDDKIYTHAIKISYELLEKDVDWSINYWAEDLIHNLEHQDKITEPVMNEIKIQLQKIVEKQVEQIPPVLNTKTKTVTHKGEYISIADLDDFYSKKPDDSMLKYLSVSDNDQVKFITNFEPTETNTKATFDAENYFGVWKTKVWAEAPHPSFYSGSGNGGFRELSTRLPGVMTDVFYPCDCGSGTHRHKVSLWSVVQHLNDAHIEWSREKIADWLDDLHDKGEINIEFGVPLDDEPLDDVE